MSSEYEVSDEVEELIAAIRAKYNWGPVSDIKYYAGTEAGDGYACKHVAVDVVRASDTLKLFVKYALKLKATDTTQMDKIYANEAFFYDTVYPIYNKFLRERGFYKGFENVPKCFGTSDKNAIALENIKAKGFVLFDRKKVMNDQHISIVLKTLARYHAISFALKDQKKQEYEELMAKIDCDMWGGQSADSPMGKVFRDMIQDTLNKFDSEEDKHILEKCDANLLVSVLINIPKTVNEFSILTKGDCWCNNIMFLYENGDGENPADVMHVDWQLAQPASPVYDVSYFFFTVASPEGLTKLDSYLKMYHSELSERITKLGSDPKILYPYSTFEKEWKQYCTYGFAMAFIVFKVMLVEKDQVTKMEEVDFDNLQNSKLFASTGNEDEYMRRIRILSEFFIKAGYI